LKIRNIQIFWKTIPGISQFNDQVLFIPSRKIVLVKMGLPGIHLIHIKASQLIKLISKLPKIHNYDSIFPQKYIKKELIKQK